MMNEEFDAKKAAAEVLKQLGFEIPEEVQGIPITVEKDSD